MKRFYKKVIKSKKPPLVSIHGYGPATLTSTLITSSTDLHSHPSDESASAQVIASVSVSVQRFQLRLRPSHL